LKPESTLRFDSLGCSKGGRQLFQGIDCTVQSGHWLHVVGANGIGKTSLLRMLCGLAPVDSGDILWNGTPIRSQRTAFQHDLCYLGHLNALQESMTVHENLAFTAALGGFVPDAGQIPAILARFGVGGRQDHIVRHLSQGQKRRVALARLALSPAALWVLDEPFVAMDEAGIGMLTELIAQHLAEGGVTVLTSHQPVEIGAIPAQILELRA
jgi:heme exporter protein A